MPTIKKHSNKNHYLLTDSGFWVRDFTRRALPVDINNLISPNEYSTLIQNETENLAFQIPEIGSDVLPRLSKVLIISDGYDFKEKAKFIYSLPPDVTIIGVNKSLCKWEVNNNVAKRKMDYYLANNPSNNAASLVPSHRYRPRCICSLRTSPKFTQRYKGNLFHYVPTNDQKFGKKNALIKTLDDYRNPVCAAIHFAYLCQVKKIMVMCCDDSFADARPAAQRLSNGLYTYPQFKIAHDIIDGMLYWLKNEEDSETQIGIHNSGFEYKTGEYISLNNIMEFFSG